MNDALIGSLIGLCGILAALGYRDVTRRIHRLEHRQSLVLRALLSMNGINDSVRQAIFKAIDAGGE